MEQICVCINPFYLLSHNPTFGLQKRSKPLFSDRAELYFLCLFLVCLCRLQIGENEGLNAARAQGVLRKDQPRQPKNRHYSAPEGYEEQKELHQSTYLFLLSLDKTERTLTGHHHMIQNTYNPL